MDNRKKYSVVIFTKEDCVEMIPSEWLISKESCMWPDKMTEGKLRKAVLDCMPYEDTWKACSVRVLYVTGAYKQTSLSISFKSCYNKLIY